MKRALAALVLAWLLAAGCSLLPRGNATPEPTATLPNPQVHTVTAPDPEAAAARFLDAWTRADYDSMYAMLSELTQDGLSREAFVERYETLATRGAITGLDYELVSSLVHPERAQVRYRITLQSAGVGDIVRETWMDLTREDQAWRVAWTDATILPELSGGNQLDLQLVTPVRANIYDRNGMALATTATDPQIVALWIVPNQIGDEEAEEAMLRVLSQMLDRRPEAIQGAYDDIRSTDWQVPLGQVTLNEFQQAQGVLSSVGGVQWSMYQGRYYVDGGLAPHAVGYVAQIQAEQLDEYLRQGYPQDAFVGQVGLEAVYEAELRGRPGGTLRLVGPEGEVLQELASRPHEPPYAVYSNLDRDLQRHVQQALAGLTGVIVVVERDSGAVLAMASSPDFDPNLFNSRNRNSGVGLTTLFQNPNQPLVNRAATGIYPLGSLFKIITMAAALESGHYEPGTIYNCGHYFTELPGLELRDWTVDKELPAQGEISLSQALVRSCNPYFFHIGLDLFQRGQTTALPDMARAFGLGQATEIEIGEAQGFVPGPAAGDGEQAWAARDAVQLSIGQSNLQATPLQAVRYVAAVGNGGTLYRPQLVQRIESAVGDVLHMFEPEAQGTLPVSEATLQAIQQAMVGVVRHDRGTARRRFLGLNLNIAGKTGTAQSTEFGDPHAWFGGYTFEERENRADIAVVVVVEHGGEGSERAAPIFRRVIEAYFFGRPISLYPWESQIGVVRTPTPTPGPDDAEAEGTPSPEG